MFKSIDFKRAALAISLPLVFSASHASPGGVGGATEATQVLNNLQLVASVAQQIETVQNLVQSLIVHKLNWKQLLLSNKQFGITAFAELGDLGREISEFQRYKDSLTRAGASIDQLKNVYDTRRAEAALRQIPFAQYIANEKAKIVADDARAVQRLETEKSIMERADSDMASVVANSAQFSAADGVVGAVGQLNTQMNQLVQQNARVAQILAHNTGSESYERRQQEITARKKAVDMNEAMQAAEEDKMRQTRDQLNNAFK